jgi:hypothetical protein
VGIAKDIREGDKNNLHKNDGFHQIRKIYVIRKKRGKYMSMNEE